MLLLLLLLSLLSYPLPPPSASPPPAQGSARVIRCLQDHRSTLSQKCAAAIFDHEVCA